MSDGSSTQKLTKKQRKALDFRSKKETVKSDVGVHVSTSRGGEASNGTSLTTTETQDRKGKRKATSDEVIDMTPAKSKASPRSLRKAKKLAATETTNEEAPDDVSDPNRETKRKRKRENEPFPIATATTAKDVSPRGKKTRFDEQGEVIERSSEAAPEAVDVDASKSKRYIVFVGNMAYTTTADAIVKHFAEHCAEQPKVRLLTTKADASKAKALSKAKQKSIAKGKALDPGAPRSRGCAFVEFASRDALQKALQFHHTQLHGRTINVELTAGGGGAGADRKEKIKKKNNGLDEERKKLHEKYVKTGLNAKKAAKKDGGEGDGGADKSSAPVVEEKKPQWGPNAAGKSRMATKIPRWAASGANAVRLNG